MKINSVSQIIMNQTSGVNPENIQKIQEQIFVSPLKSNDKVEKSTNKSDEENIFSDGVNAKSKSGNSDDPPGWNEFLAKVKKIDKYASVPDPDTLTAKETLPDNMAISLKSAVILVPDKMSSSLNLAVNDLKNYVQQVTGKPAKIMSVNNPDLSNLPKDTSIIAIGNGKEVKGLVPPVSGKAEGYNIQTSTMNIKGNSFNVVGINGDDANGQQYGIFRLMNLSGKRFFNYMDEYTPPKGEGLFPVNGFSETSAPTGQMKVRGFAPHTYHPIPVSIAFHEPGQEHLEMMKKYIDWLAQNGQNFVMFPMLELDKKNRYIPIKDSSEEKFKEWLPYAKEIVDYAHDRGVKVSIKLAFANFVSANTYAVNPLEATYQSFQLGRQRKDIKEVNEEISKVKGKIAEINNKLTTAKPNEVDSLNKSLKGQESKLIELYQKNAKEQKEYKDLLDKYTDVDKKKIEHTIDNFMNVPWDEITWNLGTSEFSATNDDLTINWMNSAADIMKTKYPGVKTSARSHIPSKPFSEEYNESYFQLIRFTDPSVGNYVHTTHGYSMTDPAPVYGNENFEEKLKYLYRSTKERSDVYYPETSYWVTYDTSVPLFLPFYMLNRKHDLEMAKNVENLDGQVGFTTAWEWGYWMNDYAMAKMQSNPDVSLTQIVDGAFAVFGKARNDMTRVMIDSMKEQQKYLVDKNMMKFMSGFSPLTDFGAAIKDIPLLNKFIEGSNSTPIRLKAKEIMKWDEAEIKKFEDGDLNDLKNMSESFEQLDQKIKNLKADIPQSSDRYYAEIADGLEINALRAKQEYALFQATVNARKAELYNQPELKAQGEILIKEAQTAVDRATEVIKGREAMYRDAPQYTYQKGEAPTIWQNRYLTPVHTAEYWKRSQKEVSDIYHPKNIFQDWLHKSTAKSSSTVGSISINP